MFRIKAYVVPYVDVCVGRKIVFRVCSNHPRQDRRGD